MVASLAVVSGTANAQTTGPTVSASDGDAQLTWSTQAGAHHASFASTHSGRDTATVITLEDVSAPTTYRFPLHLKAGQTAALQPDGSVVVSSTDGDLGEFQPPWAKDAAGRSLATSYSLDGNTLVQRIDTTNAQFPVTADPHYTWGIISGTIYFNKRETATIGWSGSMAGLVTKVIASEATALLGGIVASMATYATITRQCIKLKITPIGNIAGPGSLSLYKGGYCT